MTSKRSSDLLASKSTTTDSSKSSARSAARTWLRLLKPVALVLAPSRREVPSPPRLPLLPEMLHLLPPQPRRRKKRRRRLPTMSLVPMTTWDSVFSINGKTILLLSQQRESASVTSRLLSQKESFIIRRPSKQCSGCDPSLLSLETLTSRKHIDFLQNFLRNIRLVNKY